jgi:hypothetical protein
MSTSILVTDEQLDLLIEAMGLLVDTDEPSIRREARELWEDLITTREEDAINREH